MSDEVVQSLWIGTRLSALECLGLTSFRDAGHTVHLYCYGEVEGVPPGIILMDGNSILPRSQVFVYEDGFAKGSPAAFSNFFRYKLLLERGGWWVDADVVCLRPLPPGSTRILTSEQLDPSGRSIVSSAVIRTCAGDPLMNWAWKRCCQLTPARIRFGDIGPRLLQIGVDTLALNDSIEPISRYSPIAYFEWRSVLSPMPQFLIGSEAFTLHLWNQMWSAACVEKDGTFPATCLYEQLKRRHLR
jgi:hypothetical protein